MAAREAYFWDSNVFYRFLSGQPDECVPDLKQFVKEAQEGKCDILCSTLAFAEIRPSALLTAGFASIGEFFEDAQSVFKPIAPSPDIMIKAAVLKDWKYKHAVKSPRQIGTPDAIQLATCLHAREDLKIANLIFHTFDDGKSKIMGEKSVSLLSFEEWLVGCNEALQLRIANMPRQKPLHPSPELLHT